MDARGAVLPEKGVAVTIAAAAESGPPAATQKDDVGGYAVPVDPMDDLQCDSCQ